MKNTLDILSKNLAESSQRLTKSLEMRLAEIGFAAKQLGGKMEETEDELATLIRSDLEMGASLVADTCAKCNRRFIRNYNKQLSVADTVNFATMILDTVDSSDALFGARLLESDINATLPEDIRIVYRKARGTDIAYEKFVSLIPDARVMYKDTFTAVCDAVALDEADMCILPYENSDDGKLNSFYRLIESFDLKIAASCKVKSLGRDDMTRYLLLSKNLAGLSAVSGVTDFELLISDRDDNSLTRVMSAAHILGLTVRSIDTVKTEGNLNVFDLRVASKKKFLIDRFILFLKLEEMEFSPLGLFAQID